MGGGICLSTIFIYTAVQNVLPRLVFGVFSLQKGKGGTCLSQNFHTKKDEGGTILFLKFRCKKAR